MKIKGISRPFTIRNRLRYGVNVLMKSTENVKVDPDLSPCVGLRIFSVLGLILGLKGLVLEIREWMESGQIRKEMRK